MEEMLRYAKTWREMERLVLLVDEDGAVKEVAVKLGEPRRRWKRVAATIAPISRNIVGARGYDASGALVGGWDAGEEDDEEEEDVDEDTGARDHRLHTQWVIREVAKIFEGSLRLQMEVVREVIEVIRAQRTRMDDGVHTQSGAPATQDDETTKTLGLLLQSFMASQHNNGRNQHEDERETRGADRDPRGQGQQDESSAADTGPGNG